MLNGNSALGGELSPRMLQLVFLSTLRLDGTGVCTSAVPEFLDWLERIVDARVAACPDDHGNDASGATSISVGERAEGELESYLDEDWFRFEVGERGTLTAVAESNTESNTGVYGELYDGEGTRVGYDGWSQDFSMDWLERIVDARVAACPDDHGNDASGATSISVGERAEGELESYLDEDWFRFEVGERGTLTAVAESNTESNTGVYGELYDGEGTRVGYDGWSQDFSISRHVTPGTYYVRVTGGTEEARGSYNWVSSFRVRWGCAPT